MVRVSGFLLCLRVHMWRVAVPLPSAVAAAKRTPLTTKTASAIRVVVCSSVCVVWLCGCGWATPSLVLCWTPSLLHSLLPLNAVVCFGVLWRAVACCGVSCPPQVVVCESKLRALLAELTAMRAWDPTSKVGVGVWSNRWIAYGLHQAVCSSHAS